MKFHKDGTQPAKDEIFVFGSNLAGIHGAGAAKAAVKYGARFGQGVGLHGNTYAIPTKDADLKTLPINVITSYIDRFIRLTKEYPMVNFFITRVGCGLAGYSDKEIAPLFNECGDNCSLAEEWKKYIIDYIDDIITQATGE